MNYNLKILKALADETRLKIVDILFKDKKNVTEIVDLVKKGKKMIELSKRQGRRNQSKIEDDEIEIVRRDDKTKKKRRRIDTE